MKTTSDKEPFNMANKAAPTKLLLHACCGPCSLEPIRVLRERGIEPTIYYSNSNIAPEDEYMRRLSTIKAYTTKDCVEFIEGEYQPDSWNESAGAIGAVEPGSEAHKKRCRLCYRQRFSESAAYASIHGFDALGTTLSVSPYQYRTIIREELERACEQFQLTAFFEDYSPLYSNATRRSKEAGMYRQDYCGCLFSKAEALAAKHRRETEREERRKKRELQEAQLEIRRKERAEYDAARAHKKQILKKLREERSDK